MAKDHPEPVPILALQRFYSRVQGAAGGALIVAKLLDRDYTLGTCRIIRRDRAAGGRLSRLRFVLRGAKHPYSRPYGRRQNGCDNYEWQIAFHPDLISRFNCRV